MSNEMTAEQGGDCMAWGCGNWHILLVVFIIGEASQETFVCTCTG